jgi:hypothetical protein
MQASHHEIEDAPMYDPRNDGESAPQHEPVSERAQESAPVHEPKLAYSSSAPPRTFQAVSEHDAVAEDAHRPQRKRRESAAEAAQQQQALQLVETQAEAVPLPVDDEAPRRSKPRRRRSGNVEAEPLMLVETQGNADSQHPDGAPTP